MNRPLFVYLLLSMSLTFATEPEKNPGGMEFYHPYAFIGIGSATAAGLIAWLRMPNKKLPTIEDLDIVTFMPENVYTKKDNGPIEDESAIEDFFREKKYNGSIKIGEIIYSVQKGIPDSIKDSRTATIISDGFPCHRRPLARYSYNLIKNTVAHGPVILFKYPTDHNRAMFSFCQEQDITSIDLVVKELLKKSQKIEIALYGMCKGATTILRYLAKKAESAPQDINNIKVAIAESPVLSVKTALNTYPPAHTLVRFFLPNYDPNAKTIVDDEHFPNIPVLIGHLPHDHMAKSKDVLAIAAHIATLKKKNLHEGDSVTLTYLCTVADKKVRIPPPKAVA